MKIAVAYRGIKGGEGWATGDSMVRAFRRLGHDAVPYGTIYQTNHWMGTNSDVDFVLYMECNDKDHQYVELKHARCKKAYWEFDTLTHLKESERFIDTMSFDCVFMANRQIQKEVGTIYLPYAFDFDLFYTHCRGPDKFRDAVMVGSPFQKRVEFCSEAGVELISGALRERYISILCGSKIQVHNHSSGGNGLIVMRPWETMGMGVCLLTESSPELAEIFLEGKEYVAYNSPAECKEKVDWLLSTGVWFKIGRTAMGKILRDHLYIHRARTILDTVFRI